MNSCHKHVKKILAKLRNSMVQDILLRVLSKLNYCTSPFRELTNRRIQGPIMVIIWNLAISFFLTKKRQHQQTQQQNIGPFWKIWRGIYWKNGEQNWNPSDFGDRIVSLKQHSGRKSFGNSHRQLLHQLLARRIWSLTKHTSRRDFYRPPWMSLKDTYIHRTWEHYIHSYCFFGGGQRWDLNIKTSPPFLPNIFSTHQTTILKNMVFTSKLGRCCQPLLK